MNSFSSVVRFVKIFAKSVLHNNKSNKKYLYTLTTFLIFLLNKLL
jgi:hypothetical protein